MLEQIEADPRILDAAEKLFRLRGYHAVMLSDIATEAGVALPAVQSHFPDKDSVLEALLQQYDPSDRIRVALNTLHSNNAEELVREAVRELIAIFNEHVRFANLVMIDIQVNDGMYISSLFSSLASEAAGFINRLSNMPDTRPISSVMLGRAFASILIGFVATQQMAPQGAQFAMRIFPEKAWVDGITDIFLYGILEQ